MFRLIQEETLHDEGLHGQDTLERLNVHSVGVPLVLFSAHLEEEIDIEGDLRAAVVAVVEVIDG